MSEWYDKAGRSGEFLAKLQPLIDAGVRIYPFDGRAGPPDRRPEEVSNDPAKVDVVGT